MMSQRDSAVRLPSWLIAASLAVVVIATLTYFITTNNDNTDEAAPQSEPTQTSDAPEPDSTPAGDEKSDQQADEPEKTDEKGTSGDDKAKQDTKPQKKPEKKKQTQPEAAPDATVDVYNNSGITNLAASVSGDVQSAGFAVGGVDNWYGAIPSTTVYYPPGMEEQAQLLADALGVGRMMPAVDPMSGDRLSLILTAAI